MTKGGWGLCYRERAVGAQWCSDTLSGWLSQVSQQPSANPLLNKITTLYDEWQ